MHSAPTVNYPVGRSHLQVCLLLFLGVLGVVTVFLWSWVADAMAWRQYVCLATLLASSGLAFQCWHQTPKGFLHWDGLVWRFTSDQDEVIGSPVVHLDFQSLMLISLQQVPGNRLWLWPERRTDVSRWLGLRRALFSRVAADR